ncbi:hypothetical protein PAECIP111893_03820 [Paenibacillus plantiphilus]|uniref:Uncharacterized protein n=1 Tax=Paenibacillus plantiphilus TaxID=2905650 RepID=A0ABN8GPC4_9BACL|nr:hypothetical protein [Paenibacillus plantiphilus]CAH1214591.1 hypothetical protein PAECIP111893_03820 [Paenibacillus plantiphilus]
MIDFLKNKGQKAYDEISAIAEKPNLLFSNDREQNSAEASYNLFTIHKLNKLIKKDNISINELEQVLSFVEASWSSYLRKHYIGKSFVFYFWGDYQIPAIRVSVVSYYEGRELPFECILNKISDMKEVLSQYKVKALFDGITVIESDEFDEGNDNNKDEAEDTYMLTIYCNIIDC